MFKNIFCIFFIAVLINVGVKNLKLDFQLQDKINNQLTADVDLDKIKHLELNEVYNGPNCVYSQSSGIDLSSYHCFDDSNALTFDAPFDINTFEFVYLPKPQIGKGFITVTNNGNTLKMPINIKEVSYCSAYFEIDQNKANSNNNTVDKLYYLIRGDSGSPITQLKNGKEMVVGLFWQAVPNLPPASDNRSRADNGNLVYKPCK